jgi:hypothetical protein
MGTHAIVRFYSNSGDKRQIYIVLFYHFDGDTVGINIINFFNSGRIVNGIRHGTDYLQFNGFDCFIAQFIAKEKTGPGDMYVYPCDETINELFTYNVIFDDNTKELTVDAHCFDRLVVTLKSVDFKDREATINDMELVESES